MRACHRMEHGRDHLRSSLHPKDNQIDTKSMRSRIAIHKDFFEEEQSLTLCSTSSTSTSSSLDSPLSKSQSPVSKSFPPIPASSPMKYYSVNKWSKSWFAVPLLLLLDLLCSLVFLKYEMVLDPGFAAKVLNAQGQLHQEDRQNSFTENSLQKEVQNVMIGTEMAFNISQNMLPQATNSADSEATQSNLRANSDAGFNHKKFRIPDSEWYIDMDAIAAALKSDDGCIVYSFGIGKEDLYTNFMAEKGCHVFAFDPTQSHTRFWKPNVEFFSWGIRNSENTPDVGWSHPKYGHLVGRLLSLPEIVEKLGHQNHEIAALKFDCEGCEYGAFQDIVEYERVSGERFNPIGSLSTEFHFATTLGMETLQDVANIKYADTFLRSQDCRVIHYKPNKGFKKDRTIYSHLVKNGVPDGTCCYEYGFSCNGNRMQR